MEGVGPADFDKSIRAAFAQALATQISNAVITGAPIAANAVQIISVKSTGGYHNIVARRGVNSVVEFYVVAKTSAELDSVMVGMPAGSSFRSSFQAQLQQAGKTAIISQVSSCTEPTVKVVRGASGSEEAWVSPVTTQDMIITLLVLVFVARPVASLVIVCCVNEDRRKVLYGAIRGGEGRRGTASDDDTDTPEESPTSDGSSATGQSTEAELTSEQAADQRMKIDIQSTKPAKKKKNAPWKKNRGSEAIV